MSQETIHLYGELVIDSSDENQTGIPEEVAAVKEQTRLMIEEAAYFLAEKRGFVPGH